MTYGDATEMDEFDLLDHAVRWMANVVAQIPQLRGLLLVTHDGEKLVFMLGDHGRPFRVDPVLAVMSRAIDIVCMALQVTGYKLAT